TSSQRSGHKVLAGVSSGAQIRWRYSRGRSGPGGNREGLSFSVGKDVRGKRGIGSRLRLDDDRVVGPVGPRETWRRHAEISHSGRDPKLRLCRVADRHRGAKHHAWRPSYTEPIAEASDNPLGGEESD